VITVSGLTILEVASRARLEPRKSGHEWMVPCPQPHLHKNGDQHPSCRLNDEKGVFHCPVCGCGGGIREFASLVGVALPDAYTPATSATGVSTGRSLRKLLHFDSQGPISPATQAEIKRLLNKDYSPEAWGRAGVHEGTVNGLPAIAFPLPVGGWKACLYTRHNPARGKKYTFWFTDGGKPDLLLTGEGVDLLLTAGEWDMLAALSAGMQCVATGTGGEGYWKDPWSKRLADKRTCIAYDVDAAGKAGADKVAQALSRAGGTAYIVHLPLSGADDQDGKDLSDYLALYGAEGLHNLLIEARAAGPYRINEDVPGLSIHANEPTDAILERIRQALAFVKEDADASFKARTFKGLVPFLARLDPVAQELATREIKEKLGVGLGAIRKEVERHKARAPKSSPTAVEPPEPPPESHALLYDPDLLGRFLEDTATLGLIGEEYNKATLLLVMSSRLTSRPMNAVVKGESAAGKNHLVATVARCFPPEQVVNITSLSPQSLSYWDGDLTHKILIVAEAEGAERAEYTFRVFQSEGELTVYYVAKVGGELKTVEKTVRGPAATIMTTTRESLHPENETRLIELTLDESAEQTARIIGSQAKRMVEGTNMTSSDLIQLRWRGAQMLLDALPVIIPFADLIRFPSRQVRARRDFPKLLTLIEVCAFLHQRQRARTEMQGQTHIVADIRDYAIAYDLFHAFVERVQSGLNDREARVVAELKLRLPEHLTIRQVAEAVGWYQESGRKRAERSLKGLLDKGWVAATEPKPGLATGYWYQEAPVPNDSGISTPEEIAQAISERGGHLPTAWTSPLSRFNAKP
jgi:hypothetical protein